MIIQIKPRYVYTLCSVVLFLLLVGCANKAVEAPPTTEPTRDPNLERTIQQQLQGMNSAALPVYQEATDAMDRGDIETSKKLYEKVAVMAPQFSTVYRRLGYIELNNNNVDRAEELTRKALDLEPN